MCSPSEAYHTSGLSEATLGAGRCGSARTIVVVQNEIAEGLREDGFVNGGVPLSADFVQTGSMPVGREASKKNNTSSPIGTSYTCIWPKSLVGRMI